jgi:hypothetical protein
VIAGAIVTQPPDVIFKLAVEVFGPGVSSELLSVLFLKRFIRFGFVGKVGMPEQKLIDQRALATAVRSRDRDLQV